jgi:hypothetical protein
MRCPDEKGRLLIRGACAAAFIGVLVSDDGSTILIALGILAGTSVPLRLAPSARTWFGDKPLDLSARRAQDRAPSAITPGVRGLQ